MKFKIVEVGCFVFGQSYLLTKWYRFLCVKVFTYEGLKEGVDFLLVGRGEKVGMI